jgi:hypothetical protein
MAAALQQRAERLEQVKDAIAKRNGGISIVRKDDTWSDGFSREVWRETGKIFTISEVSDQVGVLRCRRCGALSVGTTGPSQTPPALPVA